jgi:hypothetical protein
MGMYRVTFEGTWFRRNTAPEDITMMRKLSYRISEDIAAGQNPPIEFSLLAHQKGHPPSGDDLYPTREGTFTATVWVEDGPYAGFRPRPTAAPRAKALLKFFLQDVTCRPPKLVFENVDVKRVWSR